MTIGKVVNVVPPFTGNRQQDSFSEDTARSLSAINKAISGTVFSQANDSNFTCKASDQDVFISVKNLSQARFIYLPVPSQGQLVTVKADSTCGVTNTITIQDARSAAASLQIDGSASTVLNSSYAYIRLVYDGTTWCVIS